MQIIKIHHKERRQDSEEALWRSMLGKGGHRKKSHDYENPKPWVEILRSADQLQIIALASLPGATVESVVEVEFLYLIQQYATGINEYHKELPSNAEKYGGLATWWAGPGVYNMESFVRIWYPGCSEYTFLAPELNNAKDFTLAIEE